MQSRPKIRNRFDQPASGPARASEAAAALVPHWTKPVLSVYGDVRQLTMGPTPGSGESGFPGTLQLAQ